MLEEMVYIFVIGMNSKFFFEEITKKNWLMVFVHAFIVVAFVIMSVLSIFERYPK